MVVLDIAYLLSEIQSILDQEDDAKEVETATTFLLHITV